MYDWVRVREMKILDLSMKILFFACTLASVGALLLICIFMFQGGLPAFSEIAFTDFITGEKWAPTDVPPSFGILPMILGSVYITLGAVLIGVPIGILTAVFLAKFCPKPVYKILKPAIDLLAGIPSIVYGFFGLMVVVPFVRENIGGTGSSILTASLILGIMILPTIVGISESAIKAVPESYFEGAIALGATKERSVLLSVLPAARSGILAGVVLGIGRAIGETMAVILIAGNQVWMPPSVLDGVRTLTSNIALELSYAAGLHREALIASSLVLFVFILLINAIFAIVKWRGEKKW